jgi:hypothetical protein
MSVALGAAAYMVPGSHTESTVNNYINESVGFLERVYADAVRAWHSHQDEVLMCLHLQIFASIHPASSQTLADCAAIMLKQYSLPKFSTLSHPVSRKDLVSLAISEHRRCACFAFSHQN